MKHIENGWLNYKSMVIPKDAGEIQLKETEQAFYAGACVLFERIMMILEPGEEATEKDYQVMTDIQNEINEFGQQLDVKYLKTTEH